MPTEELTALTTALDALRDASREATQPPSHPRQGSAAHHGSSSPTASWPPSVHLRLSLPEETLACPFNSSRSTIYRAIRETRQLLDQHETTITPAPTPPRPITDLIAATTAQRNTH